MHLVVLQALFCRAPSRLPWYLQQKPLKMAENLLVFWYLQLKTIENSRKTHWFFGVYNGKKPLEIQQNLCVFGYFQWKTIQNIKNLSVFFVFYNLFFFVFSIQNH